MRTRGPAAALVAAALLVVALLAGCASFADGLRESARDAGASATSTSSSASRTTSATTSPTATPSSSASSSATATTAGQSPGSPAATTQAPAPAPAPGPAPTSRPAEVRAAYGQEPWGVYLVVAEDYSAAERARMEAVHRDLQAIGYEGFIGTLCDEGAEAAGAEPYGDAVSVYFRTRVDAEQFLAIWNRPAVGYAQVLIICGE